MTENKKRIAIGGALLLLLLGAMLGGGSFGGAGSRRVEVNGDRCRLNRGPWVPCERLKIPAASFEGEEIELHPTRGQHGSVVALIERLEGLGYKVTEMME